MKEPRVLKWTLLVDDHDYRIGSGPVCHVDVMHGDNSTVYVWTLEDPEIEDPPTRKARVFGTGQPVPRDLDHVGSVVAGMFVWHVFAEPRPMFEVMMVDGVPLGRTS